MQTYFAPRQRLVPLGTSVRWVGVAGTHSVVESTPLGLFSRTLSSGETWSHTFIGAGTYPYRSTRSSDPSSMNGVVAVPLKTSVGESTLGSGVRVRWASQALPGGSSHRIQHRFRQRGGSTWTPWTSSNPLLRDTTAVVGTFWPERRGTYELRARRVKTTSAGTVAGRWSPAVAVTVE
jgi:hypothetical protein